MQVTELKKQIFFRAQVDKMIFVFDEILLKNIVFTQNQMME
jgi:hypothetical protein